MKKQTWTIVLTALIVLMLADRLKALPGVNRLPSV